MSQAEELLNSLSTDEVAAYSVKSSSEPNIIIGIDRHITVPVSLRRIAVEHDHNVETVTFECPRYWDEHDLSKMAIYINYILANGYTDAYPADNVTAEDDIMFFTWTIKREVTQVSGGIKFLVCAKKTDDEGNEVNHWNSEICEDMYVSKGMETVPQIAAEYPDLITELLLRVKSVQDINIQANEMQAILEETQAVANTAEQIKNEALDASGHIKNSYSNAVKGEVSGGVIRVDDVSPVQHSIKARVHGGNFVDTTTIPLQDNTLDIYVSSVGEGYFEITSTSEYDGNGHVNTGIKLRDLCPQLVAGKQYVLSATTDSWNKCIYLAQLDYFWQFNSSITVTEEMLDCTIGLYGYAPYRGQEPGVCRTYNVQIVEVGAGITDYEPYINPSTVSVKRYGKNLINLSKCACSNCTIYNTGVKVAIENTYYCDIYLQYLRDFVQNNDGVTLTFSIGSLIPDTFIAIVVMYEDGTYMQTSSYTTSATLTIDNQGRTVKHIAIRPACKKEVFTDTTSIIPDIQLEIGSKATAFEIYNTEETLTPAIDGTVLATSLNPTVTMFTTTSGVTIEAEYNRDINTTVDFEILGECDVSSNYGPKVLYNANAVNAILLEIAALLEGLS